MTDTTCPGIPDSVLIADDDPDVRELLAAYFSRRGHAVACARDGREALLALENRPGQFDLVVTDLQMPGADGLAVLQAAKAANPSCFVVIVSGYATIDSAVQAVRLGAFDYLTKPFTMGQMDVVLDRIADRAALVQKNNVLTSRLNGRPVTTQDLVSILMTLGTQVERLDARLSEITALLRIVQDERIAS